ncbi:MAG: phenylalanine--tRNA ligase beta subunit-related protein [Acidihalobacter sp.]
MKRPVCNALSLACAIPIAVFDLGRIVGDLQVRPAVGDETYETFRGDIEYPEPGEIIFADAAGQAHARRWTNRQSGRSTIRLDTTRALIVAEALHATAAADVASLGEALQTTLSELWPNAVVRKVAVQ